MTDSLNQRLAAILDRHPGLRPTHEGRYQLTSVRGIDLTGRTQNQLIWMWIRDDPDSNTLSIRNEEARALIFRAMVEAIQPGCWLLPRGDRWTVATPKPPGIVAPTAIEALAAFWEQAEPTK